MVTLNFGKFWNILLLLVELIITSVKIKWDLFGSLSSNLYVNYVNYCLNINILIFGGTLCHICIDRHVIYDICREVGVKRKKNVDRVVVSTDQWWLCRWQRWFSVIGWHTYSTLYFIYWMVRTHVEDDLIFNFYFFIIYMNILLVDKRL